MKQTIKIGNVVDDGSGDYLRKGGEKIINNFDELYYQLGDGDFPHAAGAWKTWAFADGVLLSPKFGESFTVNTTAGEISVQLPKGMPTDYNHVIRIRDIWSTWQKNPITVVPASGDTLKGSPVAREFPNNLQDLEFVYCSPGRWEFIENKYVDRISNSDLSTMAKKTFIATEGQTDFLDVFEGHDYNVGNVEVFRRGNLLFCQYNSAGQYVEDNSDFGSVGSVAGELIAPNGSNIRLKWPCVKGETIQIITYFDGIGTWRSSYNKEQIQFIDQTLTNLETVPGETWVGDLSTKTELFPSDLGIAPGERINPFSLEILLNGRELVESGNAGLGEMACNGAFGDTDSECVANGGIWEDSNSDYSVVFIALTDTIEKILFPKPFESGDILTVKWYNNNIGSTMTIEEITTETDKRYLNIQEPINLVNRIEYTDFNNPSQKTSRPVANEYNINVTTMKGMFDLLYPIGSIYENANNAANPADYMGMGIWTRWAEGKVVAGWSNNPNDPYYALNNNDLDVSSIPSHTAGGTFGSNDVNLNNSQIPVLESVNKVLIADDNGPIVVGGCQFDPDASGPAYTKYREDKLKVNDAMTTVNPTVVIQPTITAYRWIRVG
ncbi:baseplate wedge subunit and tail pin [Yersinia phage vB_YenM_TG1]|uniref:Baseplate wedge protein gp10 n=1 Tax=Yersinia phage vB_YenM_TG1 TaxID=1589265 RepID=A0A0B4ZXE3_9CAUD|nr:baseplate wedge subunit [Yersinia phage vB_YenM_TG1]AJD81967.1 baseplate wedge subunit and tail pin [Yersinia phage vB_YenM_TG1]